MKETYMGSFKQKIVLDEDQTVFVNYPTDKSASYPSSAPPDDLSRTTIHTNNTMHYQTLGLFMGSSSGPCIQPCIQTSDCHLVRGNVSLTIYLYFDDLVKVTFNVLAKFQHFEVLQVHRN